MGIILTNCSSDKEPVYNLTHSIRLLVVRRCETTLSWDQLRSPQVSQFLVKPIQQAIRESHFSRATLYALIANCLQFNKEGQLNPGSIGVSKTRALVCELLAMRLLKDYSTRELIDALSYDFDPLNGISRGSGTPTPGNPGAMRLRQPAVARISAIEVAIRAQSKKFLAHPLVVQQLEAIWAGNIIFHSAADYLHRPPARQPPVLGRGYGAIEATNKAHFAQEVTRRTAALYDPAESSLFKLSRLRVPRYRQLFSTCSFAIMLALFLAVLVQRSTDITALEIVFWFWSAGYMLDEIVGLTEEGFGLYIMSIWNAFDIGILLLFFAYYALRLYGIVIPTARKRQMAYMAYDVLASTAVLLFPRLFSVLDHYRYFSQLLIAFRMMALDLAAILILILIACSGFFVSFTVAFPTNEDFTAPKAAYTLFQILMGFTPAAWDIWDSYNLLGKAILTLFLCICHFLIVTILITVLTNSFMAVVANANEEHQFLFAVNTIGMVKSDALFSYIAPTNVLGWLMRPVMYIVPFRKYVRYNRTLIKITHFPLLWGIFAYERLWLTNRMYEPTDLVEQRGRSTGKMPAFTIRGNTDLFSPGARLREPSVTTFQKDRALDEVFRRPYRGDTSRLNVAESVSERKKTVVDDWMNNMGDEGGADEPAEQPRSVVDRLESRRPTMRRAKTGDGRFSRRYPSISRSIASDPEELRSSMIDLPRPIQEEDEADDEGDVDESGFLTESHDLDAESHQQNVLSQEDLAQSAAERNSNAHRAIDDGVEVDSDKENIRSKQPGYFGSGGSSLRSSRMHSRRTSGAALKPLQPEATASGKPLRSKRPEQLATEGERTRPRQHFRTISTNTILYSPQLDESATCARSDSPAKPQTQDARAKIKRPPAGQAQLKQSPTKPSKTPFSPSSRSRSRSPAKQSGAQQSSGPSTTKAGSGTTTPGRLTGMGARRPPGSSQALGPPDNLAVPQTRARPIMPPRNLNSTTPNLNLAGFLALERTRETRKPSFNAMALDLASDLGDNMYRPDAGAAWTGMPASFSTQLEAAGMRALQEREQQRRLALLPDRGRSGQPGPVGIGSKADDMDDDGDGSSNTEAEHARRMSRIMLARMSNLEQGFREVLDEVRGWRKQDSGAHGGARRSGVRTVPTTAPGSIGTDNENDEGLTASPRKRRKARDRRNGQQDDGVEGTDFGEDERERSSV